MRTELICLGFVVLLACCGCPSQPQGSDVSVQSPSAPPGPPAPPMAPGSVESPTSPNGAPASPITSLLARLDELAAKVDRPPNGIPTVPLRDSKPYLLDEHGNIIAIDLTYCPATDEDLSRIKTFSTIERLGLTGTKITDVGLAHLEDLPALTTLVVWGTQVTEEGAEAFRQSHPKCWVRGPDPSKPYKKPE